MKITRRQLRKLLESVRSAAEIMSAAGFEAHSASNNYISLDGMDQEQKDARSAQSLSGIIGDDKAALFAELNVVIPDYSLPNNTPIFWLNDEVASTEIEGIRGEIGGGMSSGDAGEAILRDLLTNASIAGARYGSSKATTNLNGPDFVRTAATSPTGNKIGDGSKRFFGAAETSFPAFDLMIHDGSNDSGLEQFSYDSPTGEFKIEAHLVSAKFSGSTTEGATAYAASNLRAGQFSNTTKQQPHSTSSGKSSATPAWATAMGLQPAGMGKSGGRPKGVKNAGVMNALIMLTIAQLCNSAKSESNSEILNLRNKFIDELNADLNTAGSVSNTKQRAVLNCLARAGITKISARGHDGVNVSVIPYLNRSAENIATDPESDPGVTGGETIATLKGKQVFLLVASQATTSAPTSLTFGQVIPGTPATPTTAAISTSYAPSTTTTIQANDDLGSTTIKTALGLVSLGSVAKVSASGGDVLRLTSTLSESEAFYCAMENFKAIADSIATKAREEASGLYPNAVGWTDDYVKHFLIPEISQHFNVNIPKNKKLSKDISDTVALVYNNLENRLKNNPILSTFYSNIQRIYSINREKYIQGANGAKSQFMSGMKDLHRALYGTDSALNVASSMPLIKNEGETIVDLEALESYLSTIRSLRYQTDTNGSPIFAGSELNILLTCHNEIQQYFKVLLDLEEFKQSGGSKDDFQKLQALLTKTDAAKGLDNGILSEIASMLLLEQPGVSIFSLMRKINNQLLLDLTVIPESALNLINERNKLITGLNKELIEDLINFITDKLEEIETEEEPPPAEVFVDGTETLEDLSPDKDGKENLPHAGDYVINRGQKVYAKSNRLFDKEEEEPPALELQENLELYEKILKEILKKTR